MHPQQRGELIKLSIYLVLAAGIGALFNQSLLFLVITLLGYAIYQLRNMFQLHNWLLSGYQEPPDAQGYWGEIFNEIYLVERSKRKSRRRLKKVLSRFQNAAEVLPYGTIILTKHNAIEWANPSACNLFGIRADRDIGQKIYNLAPWQAQMIQTARDCGATAKFAGSGGAIIGTYQDEAMFEALCTNLAEIGSRTIKPQITDNG